LREAKDVILSYGIGTWLNDILGENAKKLFFNKSLLSDLTFSIGGRDMYPYLIFTNNSQNVENKKYF
jgi:hypothetical protein